MLTSFPNVIVLEYENCSDIQNTLEARDV